MPLPHVHTPLRQRIINVEAMTDNDVTDELEIMQVPRLLTTAVLATPTRTGATLTRTTLTLTQLTMATRAA